MRSWCPQLLLRAQMAAFHTCWLWPVQPLSPQEMALGKSHFFFWDSSYIAKKNCTWIQQYCSLVCNTVYNYTGEILFFDRSRGRSRPFLPASGWPGMPPWTNNLTWQFSKQRMFWPASQQPLKPSLKVHLEGPRVGNTMILALDSWDEHQRNDFHEPMLLNLSIERKALNYSTRDVLCLVVTFSCSITCFLFFHQKLLYTLVPPLPLWTVPQSPLRGCFLGSSTVQT